MNQKLANPTLTADAALNCMTELDRFQKRSTRFSDEPIFLFAAQIESLGKNPDEFEKNLRQLGLDGPCFAAMQTILRRRPKHYAELFHEMRNMMNRLREFEMKSMYDKGRLQIASAKFFDHLSVQERLTSRQSRAASG